jgi:hypothetical protein
MLELIPSGGVGAEIGVWKGGFSAVLLKTLNPQLLHLIDPWSFQPDVPGAWYGGSQAKSQADMDAIYDDVRAKFADAPVKILRMTSLEAVNAFVPSELDWLYIDGDHRYEAVRDELLRYEPIVKPGGVVAGDDYHEGGWWDGGVKLAVDEFTAARGIVPTIIGDQFAFTVPG